MFKNIFKTAIIFAVLFIKTAHISAQSIDSFREQSDITRSVASSSSSVTSSTDPFSYTRGVTYVESVLPSTPQASSIVKFSKVPFSYSTGTAEVDIPFYTLNGKELSLPIGLHYTSGIKLDEIAGVAGLGWTLNAGGCVTRTVVDMPDEFNSPYMEHLMPSGALLSDLEADVNTTSTLSYLQRVCTHKVDARLDRYSYNACGLSGSFVIIGGEVVQLSGDGVLLDYTCKGNKADFMEDGTLYGQSPEVLSFIVTGPDGSVLTFSEREVGQHDGTGFNPNQSPLTGEKDLWSATTAWFLTSIKSASGLEEAIFSYKDGFEWDRSVVTHSQTKTSMTTTSDQVPLSSTINTISQRYTTKLLTSITLNGYKVELNYTERKSKTYHEKTTEWNFPASLSSVTIKAPDNTTLKSVDVETAQEPYDGRIILKSLTFKDSSGTTDDVWNFKYHTLNRQVSHLEQDWFGYYNGRKNTSNNGLCPFSYSPASNGTYGEPWSKRACYMSLAEMNHDGEKTSFEYGYYRLADVKERFAGSPVVKITTSSAAINGDESTIKKLVRSFSYSDDFSDGPAEPVQNMYTTTRAPYSQSDMFAPRESITWSFTLHESPVGSGPSIRDTKTYYGKVIEEVSDGTLSSSHKTKTIRYYNTEGLRKKTTSVFGRFPSAAKNNYKRYPPYDITLDPYIGIQSSYTESSPQGSPLLTREEEYAFDEKANAYKIISTINYTYAEKRKEQKILIGYEANQVWYPFGVGNCPYEYIYHYPVYASTYGGRVLTGRSEVEYFDGNLTEKDSLLVRMEYYERDSLLCLPSRLKSKSVWGGLSGNSIKVGGITLNSGKPLRMIEYVYPGVGSVLERKHQINIPVKTIYTIEPNHIEKIEGGGTTIRPFPSDSLILGSNTIENSISLDDGSVSNNDGNTALNAGNSQLGGLNSLKLEINREEIEYDYFNIGTKQVYLPKSHSEHTNGHLSWKETVTARDCYGNIAEFTETGSPTHVILWSYCGQYPIAVIENSTLEEVKAKLSNLNINLDNLTKATTFSNTNHAIINRGLRTLLPNAHISVYTYKPGVGISSITDISGVKTTFEYDASRRLVAVKDAHGKKIEEYEYYFLNQANGNGLRWLKKRVYRNESGSSYMEDVCYWNTIGIKEQEIAVEGSGDGRDLVTIHEADALLNEGAKVWLPYPVNNTHGNYQSDALTKAQSEYTEKGYYATHFEQSSRARVLASALPMFDGSHETSYRDSSVSNFPYLVWTSTGVKNQGTYPSYEVKRSSVVDADGRIRHSYYDLFGKTLGTSIGDDTPTYYVYDLKDRLTAVIGSGIELSDTLNMWRYDYDSLSRVHSKGIPGSSVREFYSYDEGNRVISIKKDGTLIENEYDSFGRLLRVFMTDRSNRTSHTLIEEHFYDAYPSSLVYNGGDTILNTIAAWSDSPVKGYESLSVLAEFNGGSSPSVSGYALIAYRYDDKGRVIESITQYPDGGILSEVFEYDFSGNQISSRASFEKDGEVFCSYEHNERFDVRGRLKFSESSLDVSLINNRSALSSTYSYDAVGRLSKVVTDSATSSPTLTREIGYTPQNWISYINHTTSDARTLYSETLGYYGMEQPFPVSYSGFITSIEESRDNGSSLKTTFYAYDHAGRLAKEKSAGASAAIEYAYDPRGNILSVNNGSDTAAEEYFYNGDILVDVDLNAGTHPIEHDSRGRITLDHTPNGGQNISYNNYLDKVSGTSSVNYSYLADGTKTSSLTTASGDCYGLVYRGPFIFRQRPDNVWVMESVVCPEGKLSESTAFIYVKDHLGSVKAVMDAESGEIVENSDYASYGERTLLSGREYGSKKDGVTLRDHFSGKEDQMVDFSLDYTDFGARFYSPRVRRWLTPDPLSEKDYGTSPYAYCAGNPINFVDPDGKTIDTVIDVGFIIYDAGAAIYHKIKGNDEKAKEYLQNLGEDVVAAAIPGLTAGITRIKYADKAVDAVNKVVHGNSKLSTKAQHSYDIIEKETGKHVKVGVSGGKVRKDGKSVRAEKQVRKKNKEAGYEKYKSEITKTYPAGEGSRDKVLKYEKKRSTKYKDELDHEIHKRPKPEDE